MTHDWRALQLTAHDFFGAALTRVVDWSGPTPDTEWSVRDLVSHVIEEQQWVPLLLDGRSVAESRVRIEPIGADLVAEWRRYSRLATDAWQRIELEATVQLSYDTVTAEHYLAEQVSDVVIHSWDLARAIGIDETLPEDLVAAAWTVFEPQKATLEASGLFASPVPVPDDAPLQSRLLALTGRDDRIVA